MDTNYIPKDINIEPLKGKTNNSSATNFRELSAHLDTSSILYTIKMEIQSKDSKWAD